MNLGAGRMTGEADGNGKPAPRRSRARPAPAVHGGFDYAELRELGLRAEDILDFSASVNPYGPSPSVRDALAHVRFDTYPDREALALCETLARFVDVGTDCVLPGSGASELIWLTALTFVRPGVRVLIVGPTYAEYARAASLAGAQIVTYRAREDDGFTPNLGAIQRRLRKLAPRLVFICNPNNPTGTYLPPAIIKQWARRYAQTLFVVDEAYLPFALELENVTSLNLANVLVLRSLTKDCALAGLRLGYAVGAPNVVESLRRMQPPWSVNALAQAAGIAAVEDRSHRERTLALLVEAKAKLAAGLAALGLPPLPSAGPYFLLRVGDGAAFRRALLNRGVLVRDCASFGLPAYVRISVRQPQENARLLDVIRATR